MSISRQNELVLNAPTPALYHIKTVGKLEELKFPKQITSEQRFQQLVTS